MNKNEISFIVEGLDYKAGADEIKKIISDEFDYDPPILTEKENSHVDKTKALDPIAVGALLLSIPGTIIAITDLASRIKNRKKLDQTLEKVQKQVIDKKELTVKIVYPDGMVKEISCADSIEIIDHFSK